MLALPSVLALAVLSLAASATATPWDDTGLTPIQRATALVGNMTLEEKLSLFHGSCGGYTGNVCGIDRLRFPQIKMNDGPQGFRGAAGTSTSWPASLTVAAAFDVAQTEAWGRGMGREFYDKGANVQLGPGLCVARVPRNGRNFEYISGEDPFLGFHMSAAVTRGIQSQGVVATAKHYVDNSQETNRNAQSEDVDERTQFEMYYPPFEGAISVGLGAVMCSYNKICYDCDDSSPVKIGNWSCENHDTLQRDLKDRLGFKGWVMSDWGATHSPSMNRGLDQEMPGASHMGADLAALVKSGEVPMARVDDGAVRVVWPFFAVGVMDQPNNNSKVNNVTSPAHTALAREIAANSTILLKNDGGLLPIDSSRVKTIAVIGGQASQPIVHGGGSGQVFPDFVPSPLSSIRSRLGLPPLAPPLNNCSGKAYEADTDYYNQDDQSSAPAASVDDCCQLCGRRVDCNAFTFVGGTCWMKKDAKNRQAHKGATSGICKKTPQPSQDCAGGFCVHYDDGSNATSAAALAAAADVALIFVGTSSSEGSDRSTLDLDAASLAAIDAVARVAGKKTAVVAVTPAALLTEWRDGVAAVITPLMPGQEYGNAITDVLFGDVNPGGRLPITFPAVANQVNFTQENWPGVDGYSMYTEKLLVGYRWYAAHNASPAFPFGHGLSYTTFQYDDLTVEGRTVSCKVTNTGSVAGSDVPQLYLGFPSEAGEPPMQLKGFQKLFLGPGESATATFALDDRSFSIWDVSAHAWAVVKGSFQVYVGASSGDIRLTGSITP